MTSDKHKKIANSFGLEVFASNFLEYVSEDALLELIASGSITTPFLHIGSGSNLLFLSDYEGTILHSCIGGIEVTASDEETVSVRVGAGVIWDAFVAHCVEHNWYGVENLSGIPGEVGAAAVQNIGAYGVEVRELITSVETLDIQGKRVIYRVDECGYAYRRSSFKQPEMQSVFVTYVNFRLRKKPSYELEYGTIRHELSNCTFLDLQTVRDVILRIRRTKLPDPEIVGNAGSFFMNPIVSREKFQRLLQQYPSLPGYPVDESGVKLSAGWMIEQCGWKGKRLGRVGVYDKQALVLVNFGGATGWEIANLSDAVRASVREKFGVEIRPEVKFVGAHLPC